MKVLIPGALRSYTARAQAEASGATLGEVLADLDTRYPGIRFRVVDEQGRIRRHIRMFAGGRALPDLSQPLDEDEELVIVQALSGG